VNNKLWRAVSLQIGTIIGAGIFGLPYAIAHAGLPLGVFYLVFLTIISLLVNLAYAEVILRTPGDHQLTGYSRLYLRRAGTVLGSMALMAGSYGALLAYTAQMGKFASLLSSTLNTDFFFSLAIFSFAVLAVVSGLKRISQLESLIVPGIITVVFLVIILGLKEFEFGNIPLGFNDLGAAITPYGVIFFALSGTSVIPEVEEVLRDKRQLMKKAMLLGTLVPAVIYLVFTLVIIGISGAATSADAVSGLQPFLPLFIIKIGALLGLLTMFSSFLTLSYVLKEMFYRDFGLNTSLAWLLSFGPPLALFLLGTRGFIRILEVSGSLMGGLTGIIIMQLFLQAKKEGQRESPLDLSLPHWVIVLICLVFVGGMAYEVIPMIVRLL